MRVLFCNKYNYRFSGTEVYLFELMELMRSNGHEVALFSMADDRGDATPYDRHFVPHIDFKGELSWQQKVRGAAHLIYSIEARRVQGLDWQRRKWGWLASKVLQFGEKASVHFPDGTMVVSRALQTRYREQHGVDAFYVPNGGALRQRKEPRAILEWRLQPADYVLYLGRFSPEKGCHLLVEAFEQLETNTKLVMAGGSSYCDEYSRRLRTHASDRIRMLEGVSGDTLDELITNAMIFVLPSDLEGLSLALLDAMGASLCVLTSDVPENREVVDGAGFTFQRGNATDLADRLRFLIANPAIREAAGRAARSRIEDHYQWQKIAENIERAYLEILKKDSATVLEKKPGNMAAITGEDLPLKRRAG